METREIILLAIGTLVAAGLLFRFRPQDRGTLFATLGLVAVGIAVEGIARLTTGEAMPTVTRVLAEAAAVTVGIGLVRLLGLFVFRLLLPRMHVEAPRIAEDIIVVIGYVAWILVRLRYAGVEFTGLVTASAVMTAIIAFSMQDTLGNILGGIALQLDDSLQIGDWIKVDDLSGKVIEIRWRSTSMRTRNGEIVFLPNSVLMKNRFMVLGRPTEGAPVWRRWIRFESPGDIPPARVIDTVQAELRGCRIPDVSDTPQPDCVLMGFDNGLCQYAVRYWLTDFQRDDPTDSQVRAHVHAALRRADIPLAMPQYRLRTITENAEFEATRAKREMNRRLGVLQRADIFSKLTGEERETLAARLQYSPYAAGDTITRQGAVAHWLYFVTSGEADVVADMPDGTHQKINTLRANDFFGEMALMTGAPRRANVVARTDVECYRLDKQAFADLIAARPAIAEEISHVLASRQVTLDTAERDKGGSAQNIEHQRHELLGMIRSFFGIGPG